MSPAEPPPPPNRAQAATPRYGRYVGLLAVLIVLLITLNTLLTKPNGGSGVVPGRPVPPFAAPLASGRLAGDPNVSSRACGVRGHEILNICELYEQGPVVLALFVNGGSCPQILDQLQALLPAFPLVRFAAVAIAIKGESGVRKLVSSHHLGFPVALDRDGAMAGLYKLSSCPQVSFIYPGGVVESPALLEEHPAQSTLRARVAALLGASRARGFKP